MIFPGFPGVPSFFQVFQVFQVEWEPWFLHQDAKPPSNVDFIVDVNKNNFQVHAIHFKKNSPNKGKVDLC